MKKRWLKVFFIFLIILPISFLAVLSTDTGTRYLINTVLPKEASIQTIQGSLLNQIILTNIHYKTDYEDIKLQSFLLAWQPSQLVLGRLNILNINIDHITVHLTDKEKPESTTEAFDFDAPFALPLALDIQQLLLTDLTFIQGETIQSVEKFQFTAKTEQDQLKIPELILNAKPLNAALQGRVQLGKGFAFNLKTDWQANIEKNSFKGMIKIQGNTKKININTQLNTPFTANLTATIDKPLTEPLINARLIWQDVKYPFTNKPDIQSKRGYLKFNGLLSNYRLQLNAVLQQDYLADSSLVLDGQGNLESLNINKLELLSKTGQLLITGKTAWQHQTSFDLHITGQDFNPAIILPDLTGNLSLNSHIQGQLTEPLQLNMVIDQLGGQLRGYPVNASGKLLLLGEQLTVDELKLNSGRNYLSLNGTLGQQQATLNVLIDTPALNTLWQGLSGSLKGQGSFVGELQHPSVKLQLAGQDLSFAEQSLKNLNLHIDYDATHQQNSQLQLLAEHLNTGSTKINKLALNGQGKAAQHHLTADINSDDGDINGLITGILNNNHWQGALEKLTLNHKQLGLWQLNQAMKVDINKTNEGINISSQQACLSQQTASLCLQGQYVANGDFAGQLNAVLPSHLIAAQLPKNMKLDTELHTNADIKSTKGQLNGQYQVKLSPIHLSLENNNIELGSSLISGTLNGANITNHLDISLIDKDFIQGQIELNTHNQALSGHLTTSINALNTLKSFLPSLETLSGQINSQIQLFGTLKKPLLQGDINVNHGQFKLATNDFSVQDINLHAKAFAGEHNRIQLQGSLAPQLLSKKPEALQFTSRVNLNADIEQDAEQLNGRYQVEMIPSRLQIANTKLALGTTLLTGQLTGKKLLTDLKLALFKQDYLTAKLQLALDDSQSLSGNINASIHEFAALNPLVPQLSKLTGQLNANLTLAGTTQKPTANGFIHLNSAGFVLADLGLELHQIQLQAQTLATDADRIQLTGSAKSGEGQIKLTGDLSLQPEAGFPINASVLGENFEVVKIPEAEIAISPQLKLAYAKTAGTITGKINVPKAVIQLQQVPESAIKVSSDEVILGEALEQEQQAPVTPINAKIDLELGKNVNFSGMGLKTDLQGKLQLVKTGEKIAMYGNVNMDKARYKSYGQDLTVRKGQFVFNGPTDNPSLDVEATRLSSDKKVTAVLSVQGNVDKPKTRIYTEPSLPETEALAYLITGKPINQASKAEGNIIANAALSYGAGQASWLTEKLGIDEFEVQEGQTLKDTLLAVGEYITPDFYVGAKVGLFNKQVALVLKHKLTESLNVETQTGESQRIKLNYEIDTD